MLNFAHMPTFKEIKKFIQPKMVIRLLFHLNIAKNDNFFNQMSEALLLLLNKLCKLFAIKKIGKNCKPTKLIVALQFRDK